MVHQLGVFSTLYSSSVLVGILTDYAGFLDTPLCMVMSSNQNIVGCFFGCVQGEQETISVHHISCLVFLGDFFLAF